MLISIKPRGKMKLADLHLDTRQLQYFDVSLPSTREYRGYDTDDGLVVSLFNQRVLQVVYLPAKDNRAPCLDYYKRPESFVEVFLPHVPVVSRIDAPASINAGEKLKVTAYSNINETRGYTWTVNAGKITAGQYTKEVTIDTTGLAGQTLIVTAEIGEWLRGHTATGSCAVRILPTKSLREFR